MARATVAILAALAFSGIASAASAEGAACAAPLAGDARPYALPERPTEAQRIAASTIISESLRATGRALISDEELAEAPACELRRFWAGDQRLVLSGGMSPLPVRWAISKDDAPSTRLIRGALSQSARSLGFARVPYLLVGASEDLPFVLKIYDGAPSDDALAADITQAVTDEGFAPVGLYDPEGDAVTLFRVSEAGLMSQIFGRIDADHPAMLHGPDGRYFQPDGHRVLLAGSGLSCPLFGDELGSARLAVLNVEEGSLELACQYLLQDGWVLAVVTETADEDLKRRHAMRVRLMRKDFVEPTNVSAVLSAGVSTRFPEGAAWIGKDGRAGGVWSARSGGYVIEVEANWTKATEAAARSAITRLEQQLLP